MKTKESIYSALFIGCLLAAAPSCSNEDDKLPKEKTPVGITATLTGEVETKAETNYTPTTNTKIYMYYNNGANTTATEKAVYTYSSGTWNTANQTTNASDCIFWDDLGKVGGNYPFFAISPTDVGATSTAVQENQNTGTNLVTSDLLMAYTPNTAFKGKVNLVFKHMLSKLTIKVDVSKVANASSVGVKAVINKAVKNYTVNYAPTNISLNTPATVTKGTTTATITPMTVTGTGTTRVFSTVLPAQDIQSGLATITVTVTQKGSGTATDYTYTYQPAAASKVTLEQGKETTLTLTIKGTVVELGTIKVTDWTSKTASGDITIDNP